jgi:pimeloyl-ACP methyl ester carboxylesterase
VWQTPGEGEAMVATFLGGTAEERAAAYALGGMPIEVGTQIAAGQNPDLGRAILLVYRSAAQPAMARAGRDLENAAARPGLSVLATEDTYVGSAEIRRRAAERAGARTEVLEGLGHWWMVEDPARSAAVLNNFWSGL